MRLDALAQAVDAGQAAKIEAARSYLGGSTIGDPCARRLWYGFRGYGHKAFPPRVRRIFQFGHMIEDYAIELLRGASGVTVLDRDPTTGKQFEAVLFGGHAKDHFDGLIKAPSILPTEGWHLLEIKSMNDKLWRECEKHGVAKSHPKYWVQMQKYMASETCRSRGVGYAVFYAINKNDCSILFELVPFEPMQWLILESTARTVIESAEPATKVASTPNWFQCKDCEHRPYCWDGAPITPRDCRQCRFSVADTVNGGWVCGNPDSPHGGKHNPVLCNFFGPHDGHSRT